MVRAVGLAVADNVGEIAPFGGENAMHMVAHNAIGVDAQTFVLGAVVKGVTENVAVALTGKDISPLGDLEGEVVGGVVIVNLVAGRHGDKIAHSHFQTNARCSAQAICLRRITRQALPATRGGSLDCGPAARR